MENKKKKKNSSTSHVRYLWTYWDNSINIACYLAPRQQYAYGMIYDLYQLDAFTYIQNELINFKYKI